MAAFLAGHLAVAADSKSAPAKHASPEELPEELQAQAEEADKNSPAKLASEAAVKALVWPAPPLPERVRYAHEFNKAIDLGIKPSFFSRLFGWLTGNKPWPMVRPYAIAADDGLIAIADPGVKSVFLFNLKDKEQLRIHKVGKDVLESPVGIALSDTRLFISDSNKAQLHILDREGEHLKSVSSLARPTGLAWHAETKRLYVADTLAHKIVVFNENGEQQFEFGRRADKDAGFNFPSHLAVHGNRVYVNDTMNFRVQIFDLEGQYISKFGVHGDGSGQFSQPKGIGIDVAGHIYIADSVFHKIQIFDDQGRYLLDIGQQGRRAGEFWLPAGVFVYKNRIYVADSYNRRVQVFDYTYKGKGKGSQE